MFKIDQMIKVSKEAKKRLFDSIGVVVTKSKDGTKHYDYLEECADKLRSKQLSI